MPIEREIKLRFATPDVARERIATTIAGVRPLRPRRLQHDRLLDTADGALARRGCALRVRSDGDRAALTFKGPVLPGVVKMREEHETPVGDAATVCTVLGHLGFHVWFRYEKYREEFAAGPVVIAIDETPIGVFVEIEGDEAHIATAAAALGAAEDDYVTASYRTLYLDACRAGGREPGDMLFA